MSIPIVYDSTSMYAKTPIVGKFLGYYVDRAIPPNEYDRLYTITNPEYVNRPDLLALDIYGNDELEWVIPKRNGLQDMVYDLQLGVQLIIPDPGYINSLI